MDINSYLSENCVVRVNYPTNLIGVIDSVLVSVLNNMSVDIKIIATNKVFPRVLEFGNKKLVLLWDQTYFELYNIFLYGLADLQYQLKLTNSSNYDRTVTSLVISPFLYFLSLVVRDEMLSKKFAYHYHLSTSHTRVLYNDIPSLLSEYFEISKHYLSIHEQIHILLLRGEIDKNELMYSKIAIDNIYKLINERFDEEFMRRFYLFPKSTLLEAAISSSSDNRMLEELLCDAKAALHCHQFYLNHWKSRYKKEVILTKCEEAISTLHIFDSMLLNLLLIWKEDMKNNSKLELSQRLCCLRAHLSEIIFKLLQVQQNLDVTYDKNSLLFSLIDGKLIIEELFHTWFVKDSTIDFWINRALLPSYPINVFELLDWEINHEN